MHESKSGIRRALTQLNIIQSGIRILVRRQIQDPIQGRVTIGTNTIFRFHRTRDGRHWLAYHTLAFADRRTAAGEEEWRGTVGFL